jgi:FkbM family methyltransferase
MFGLARGSVSALRLALRRWAFFQEGLTRLYPYSFGEPFFVRPQESDASVFHQIFGIRSYELPPKLQPKEARWVIDAGANIGCSTLYFAKRYPNAKVVAIEPEESNFSLLEQNTWRYGNVQRLKGALWSKRTSVGAFDKEAQKWAFRYGETSVPTSGFTPAFGMGDILAMYDMPRIDILKLDIEGAEKEVFTEGYEEWLDLCDVIMIELHENYAPMCTHVFYAAISSRPFIQRCAGEHLFVKFL